MPSGWDMLNGTQLPCVEVETNICVRLHAAWVSLPVPAGVPGDYISTLVIQASALPSRCSTGLTPEVLVNGIRSRLVSSDELTTQAKPPRSKVGIDRKDRIVLVGDKK
jgi:hypothetical protein